MVFPLFLASLLVASPDVLVVSCDAFAPLVAVVLSAVDIHGVPAVVRVSTLVFLTLLASLLLPALLTCLLLLVLPLVLVPLLFHLSLVLLSGLLVMYF
jgi:hypothetical protein